MSSLAYTRDPSSAQFYDVTTKELSRKELREITVWYCTDPRFKIHSLESGLPIEKLAINHLKKGRMIAYDFRNQNGELLERCVGAIYKRRGAELTVFNNLNWLHIVTIRHEHPFWEYYLAKKADRHFRMLKRRIRNINLKDFLKRVEFKAFKWPMMEVKFQESYFDEKVHEDRIACNVPPGLVPLSHKLVRLIKIANKLKFSN